MTKFLDPVALSRLGTLQLKARTVVEGALTGLHRSPHHGSSVEFAEHKEYSPGDEIRHIDWKAYGKFDRYYVKRFEQETELSAYLVLDCSGSMAYRGAGVSKLEYAAFLAAALSYLLIRQQDRVGLLAFGGEEGGRGAISVAAALDRVAELARRRKSLVLVLSDLFDPSPEVVTLLRRLRVMRHDVSVFHILDDHELELPFQGVTLFESLEDDRRLIADPRSIRSAYLRELDAFLKLIRQGLFEGDVEYQLVRTSQPLERTLLDFLVPRVRGLRRAAG